MSEDYFEDDWHCPACKADLIDEDTKGSFACPKCGAALEECYDEGYNHEDRVEYWYHWLELREPRG